MNNEVTTATEMDNKQALGLSDMVRQQLKDYFVGLDGQLPAPGLYKRVIREIERPLITMTLKATNGNQKHAAEILGINRNTLKKKMDELGVAA